MHVPLSESAQFCLGPYELKINWPANLTLGHAGTTTQSTASNNAAFGPDSFAGPTNALGSWHGHSALPAAYASASVPAAPHSPPLHCRPHRSDDPDRGIPQPAHRMASSALETCGGAASALARPPALLDYAAIHSCLLRGDARLSLPLLALLLALHFRILAAAAGAHFTPAVSRLAARLRLSPSMAAVTLIALGNGAPDAFASAAALGGPGGMPRAGLAAILSAGAFVSAFVVGAVALIAAPFAVPPASFARDVFCYLVAASGLFYIYLSAEIFLWQAVGFVLFYAFFVGLVFYMDLGAEGKAVTAAELDMAGGIGRVAMGLPVTVEDHKQHHPTLCAVLGKVCCPLKNCSYTIPECFSSFFSLLLCY
jgi:hypothetical protein